MMRYTMAPKKPNLAAAIASREQLDEPAGAAERPAAAPDSDEGGKSVRSGKYRPSREGLTNIAAWFPMAVRFQLDELRLRLGRERKRKVTLGELQAEAYNDLFKKYGMAEIAPSRDD